MKKKLFILFIAFSCKLSFAQVKISTNNDSTANKPNKDHVKAEKDRNPVDSINPFKRRSPNQQKPIDDKTVKTDTLKTGSSTIKDIYNTKRKRLEENNTNSTQSGSETQQATVINTSNIKSLDNNIDFSITGCVGDPTAQMVTVFFTFSNPRKANQAIWIRAHGMGYEFHKKANAIDKDGNQFAFGGAAFGQGASNRNNREVKTQLPTGVPVSGSIKFLNVLPTVTKFSLINIPSGSSNWDGGSDKKEGVIEIKDVTINWK